MPKEKQKKKSVQLRHSHLGQEYEEKPLKNKRIHSNNSSNEIENNEIEIEELETIPEEIKNKIFNQARDQRMEMIYHEPNFIGKKDIIKNNNNNNNNNNDEEDSDYDDEVEEEENDNEELVENDGEYVDGNNLSEAEEALVRRFLDADRYESRNLADIILDKIKEKDVETESQAEVTSQAPIPSKVVEVYTMVGKMLKTYKSGKLPKALKMLPHLKNWEEVLWLTRPDEWSPAATFACTRIFASNLNVKMAQRFYSIVLLEKCREDIRSNNKLNYHLYMALKKALFKPGAFYKGLLLPLADSKTCTLREATIIGSVLAKVSIPGNHSAAALLKLSTMSYSGSTSLFIKILINKRYALPRRVVDSLVDHFIQFQEETRVLPVLWHQSLLAFAQRYKFELSEEQRNQLKLLLRVQQHHTMTPEIRRELFTVTNVDHGMSTLMSMS